MTETFTVLFEPIDVLVFKDHRPFDAGEHAASSSRWPLPSTFFGALRTALMLACGAKFTRDRIAGLSKEDEVWLGDAENPGKLQLRGPFLAVQHGSEFEAYFPGPLGIVAPLEVPELLRFPEGCALSHLPWPDNPATKAKNQGYSEVWWTASGLQRWMEGAESRKGLKTELDSIGKSLASAGPRARSAGRNGTPVPGGLWRNQADLVQIETRTGLARDADSRTAAEGMLYSLETWRFRDGVALAVEVDAEPEFEARVAALDGTVVRLGGKGHRARLRVSHRALLPARPTLPDGRVCVLFLLPVVLSPEVLSRRDRMQQAGPGEASSADSAGSSLTVPEGAKLCSLYSDRNELPHGGWDFARRCERKLTPMLPAGTVAYLDGVRIAALETTTWGQEPGHHRAGFGTFVYGAW